MRSRIATILAMAAAIVAAAASCVTDEKPVGGGGGGDGEAVTLLFDPSSKTAFTRAGYTEAGGTDPWAPDGNGENGSDLDNEIKSFRILVYYPDGHADAGTLVDSGDPDIGLLNLYRTTGNHGPPPYRVPITTGTYDFVFIANEYFSGTRAGWAPDYGNISNLEIMTFDSVMFNEDFSIPMVRIHRNVTVLPGSKVNLNDGTDDISASEADPWKVGMESVSVRLSMRIRMSAALYAQWNAFHDVARDVPGNNNEPNYILLRNSRTTAFMAPERDNSTFTAIRKIYAASGGYQHPGLIEDDTNPDNPGGKIVFVDRIIIPEVLFFKPENAADKAPEIAIFFMDGDVSREKTIKLRIPSDSGHPQASTAGYTLPRNTWLWVDADVTGNTR